MLNYKLLYKIFSILVVAQIGLVAFMFVNPKKMSDQPLAQASIAQNQTTDLWLCDFCSGDVRGWFVYILECRPNYF